MFNKIQNPETGNWVNINGSVGKQVLRNYVRHMEGGSPNRLVTTTHAIIGSVKLRQLIQKNLDKLDKKVDELTSKLEDVSTEEQEMPNKISDNDVQESLYLFSRIHILSNWAKSTKQGITATWWQRFKHHYPYALLSNIIYSYVVNNINNIEWDQSRKWYNSAKENNLFLLSSDGSKIIHSENRDPINIYYSPTAPTVSESIQVHHKSTPDSDLVLLEIKFWRKQGTGITTLIYDKMHNNTLIIMVIYRGTASLSDVKSDIKQIVPGKRDGIPFNQDLHEFKLYLNDAINYNNPTEVKIFITGHSLGGTRSIHLASELNSIIYNISPIIKEGNSPSQGTETSRHQNSLSFVGGVSSSSLNKIKYTITTIVFNPGISTKTPLKESCLNNDSYNKYREGVSWAPDFCKNLTIHRIENDVVSGSAERAYLEVNASNSQVHTHRFGNSDNSKILGIFRREKFKKKNWLNAHIMDHFILCPFND
tara:strand:+ start:2570 stop:4006 length:1437 start_codon:yes stop_codon:yes gene_type:complete